MTKTLIVDGTNILVRSQFAMRGKELSVEEDGEVVNTGPVLTFINMLSKYVSQVEPDHMAVCWDGGRSTFRMALYPEYKSARPDHIERGKEERVAANLASEFLTLAGIHHMKMDGVEADDLVAGYWRQARIGDERDHTEVFILSGDKDFLQLLERGPDLDVYQIRPGVEPEMWDQSLVIEKFGCFPSDLPKVMALSGDKGDGVPGLDRVGTKTAVKMLERNGWDLSLVVENEPKATGQGALVETCYRLVDLRTPGSIHVPPVPKFSPTQSHQMKWQSLLDWCARYGFDSVIRRLHDDSLWKSRNLTLR